MSDASELESLKHRVQKSCDALSEHCESVHIFVTVMDHEGHTRSIEYGHGNFYARLGQIDEWLTVQKTFQRLWAQKKDQEDDD